jgi:uncharacterized protein YgfB (UPF0149 family)
MADENTSYSILGVALDGLGSATTAAELHGGYCGVLCSGGASDAAAWLKSCAEEFAPSAEDQETARSIFAGMEYQTVQGLASSNLEFEPLLPDDDTPLDERASELALWCHAFLTGLALGGLKLEERPSQSKAIAQDEQNPEGAVNEIVNDFSAISQAGPSDNERDNPVDADFAMAEIVEYIRVSVQIVFEELGASKVEEIKHAAPMTEH